MKILPLNARHVVDKRSSPRPFVILLSEFAVHGAIRIIFAHFDISKCRNDSSVSDSSIKTLFFDIDSNVLSVINDVEALVIITFTCAPLFFKLLTS